MSSERVLLPTNVVPSKYHITLAPDFTTFKAKGTEYVDVTVKETTQQIQVHTKQIVVESAELISNGQTISAKNISYDEKEDRALFDFGQDLPLGHAVLKVKFEAVLNDDMAGFYRSKYVVNGETRWMATTQFEATDARRAFPCWDEPAVKAIFEVTLVVPADRVALSNMLPVSESVDNEANTKTIKYAPTPIMSTYLLAFVVGEFDYVEDYTKDEQPVRVRVYTPPGRKESGKFALDVGTKTLKFFGDYFGVRYPLPKLDMVAIADFAAGAMENWGLVTYREVALLVDEKNASVPAKQRVAYIVAHELAHQWFGNLVTMEWWSQLWLNEGFATFVGNLATDHLFPQWDIWTLFVNDYQFSAFELDALKNSHPIEVDVKNSAQINEIFDAISYHKGSCVIRMVEKYVGGENFRLGLERYLKKFNYKNAVTEDLWQALGEQSGVDVKTFMDAYTKKVGYPLISVKRGSAEGTLEVSQGRFLGGDTTDDDTLWNISAVIAHKDKVTTQQFTTKSATLQIPFKNDEWVKLNYGQPGFFRVQYSADLLQQLLVPLKSGELPAVDRLGVQGDVFALAKAGVLPTSQFLDVVNALQKEDDYTVWNSVAANLGAVQSLLRQDTDISPHLAKFVQQVFTPLFNKLGWKAIPGERDVDALLRSIVLRKLAGAKYGPVIEEARKLFSGVLTDISSLSADLRTPVFEAVAANGDESTFNSLVELYKKADTAELKNLILQVLPQQPTPELTKKAFEFSLGPDVRDMDLYMLFVTCHGVPHGSQVGWKFLQDNWDTYYQRLSNGSMMLARIIGKSTEKFTSNERADEVEAFFAKHPFAPAERTMKQSVENIRRNAKWLGAARENVGEWLKTNGF